MLFSGSMEKTDRTATPTATPSWTNRIGGGEAAPPQPSDLRLKSAQQATGFFATFPKRLKDTFEFIRDHPGQFIFSTLTSIVTYSIVRVAIGTALGISGGLLAAVALAMLTSATVTIGREILDDVYSLPPDKNDLAAPKRPTFGAVLSKALTRALWSGAIAGLTGSFLAHEIDKFEWKVEPMDGEWANYDPAVNGPNPNAYGGPQSYLEPSPLAYDGTSAYVWPVDPESAKNIFDNCGLRWGRDHTGMDISAPENTPVRAAADGIVTEAQWRGGYGQTIVIKHLDETGEVYAHTRYAHLNQYHVRVGDQVEQNTLIGRVGSTGNSTGNHLHFEIRGADNTVYNPVQFLPKLPEGMITRGQSFAKKIFDVFVPEAHSR